MTNASDAHIKMASHPSHAKPQASSAKSVVVILADSSGTGTILNTETLEASFENVPQDHDGSTAFTFNVAFDNDISITPTAMRDHAFTVTNGDVTAAEHVNGSSTRWLITVDPDGDQAITITLPGNRACATQGAICSDEDNPVQLGNSPSATVAAPPEGDPLTASFSNVPGSHDGSDFFIDLTFSEGPDVGWRDVKNALSVSGGSINRVSRETKGSNAGWDIKVRPAGSDSLTITLPATTNCSSSDAICTDDDRRLSNSLSVTIAEASAVVETTPTISIAGGSVTEGDSASISFTVTLDEAASETVTVDYATSDGSADASDDYTAKSGTLSFSAGDTSKTISIAIKDDIVNESDETFTVTLSNASGAELGASQATGTIRNRYVAPLTASFANVPAEHNGSAFTFELDFSENVQAGYARIRDQAFTVSGGAIASARRITQGSNQGWTITVNPDGNGDITITLPETTDCDASGAICTDDRRKLSHSTSEIVAGPPAISVSGATVQEAEGAVLEFSVTLSHASSRTVTVDYATSDGTATAGSDYTAASGALTFNAGDMSQTVEVTVLTDSDDEGQETLTLTLSNPSSATLADATGTGTIENGESTGTQDDPPAEDPVVDDPVVLVTATFSNVPAAHNGSAFTFELAFSENVQAGYARIRDHAFTVSGGDITSAVRKEQGSNQGWTITVNPNGTGDITITLPETTDCAAQRAVCTADGRKLSNQLQFTVSGTGQ